MKTQQNALIGARFSKARKDAGLTQADVAAVVSGSPQQISNWEKGIKAISLFNLLTMAPIFGVSLGWLAGENDYNSALRDAVFSSDSDLMAPFIENGDSVEVNTDITSVNEPGIFAIKPADKVIFRWLRPSITDESYTISVTNPANWESETVKNSDALTKLNIIGKVVAVTKKL